MSGVLIAFECYENTRLFYAHFAAGRSLWLRLFLLA
jgi:hypothetical protein